MVLSRFVALSVSLTLKASILQKFQGGALAPNGKIYACPYRSSSVLVTHVDSPPSKVYPL